MSGSKCNCKRVVCAGGGRGAFSVFVCVWGGVGMVGGCGCNCYTRTTKCNIKKLLSEREKGRFWQTGSGGGHMFSASQVVIINHHQEKPVRKK